MSTLVETGVETAEVGQRLSSVKAELEDLLAQLSMLDPTSAEHLAVQAQVEELTYARTILQRSWDARTGRVQTYTLDEVERSLGLDR
jgi:hypothetical protein